MPSVQQIVTEFLTTAGDKVLDDAVVAYLAALLDESENVDFEELTEVIAGFSAGFADKAASEQHELLWNLLRKVGSAKGPPGYTSGEVAAQQTLRPGELAKLAASDADVASFEGSEPHCDSTSLVAVDQVAVTTLLELCPPATLREYAEHILQGLHQGNLEAAAQYVLETDDLPARQRAWRVAREQASAQQAAAERAAAAERRRLLERYQLQAVPSAGGGSTPLLPAQSQGAAAPQGRYRDGRLVSTRGEKYIVEKLGEDWDGGSKGKVYTKGKRGKGFA